MCFYRPHLKSTFGHNLKGTLAMNSYEVIILFKAEEDADKILTSYESNLSLGDDCLEKVLPKLFQMKNKFQSENFNIEVFKKNTNEILISAYGTKYPSFEIQNLFTDLIIESEYGIKLKCVFDGDGKNEFHYIVNGSNCSGQKFSAFYRKFKVKDPVAERKKSLKKKVKAPKKKVVLIDPLTIQNQQDLINKMDYGKDKNYRTAIIRLLIKESEDRDKIYQVFKHYKNIKTGEELNQFSNSFNKILSPKSKVVYWKQKDSQNEDIELIAPDNFMLGHKFLFTDDEYIYLGFDTELLTIHSTEEIHVALRNLVNIFGSIKVVKKCWIKYRSGKNTNKEWIIRHPVFGGSIASLRKITEDYKW